MLKKLFNGGVELSRNINDEPVSKDKEPREYFKMTRLDGWDVYTGNSVNYRDNIGQIVYPREEWTSEKWGTEGLLYALDAGNAFNALLYFRHQWPFSLFRVKGIPVIESDEYNRDVPGFLKLDIIKEINVLNCFLVPKERLGGIDAFEIKTLTKINDGIMDEYNRFQKTREGIIPSIWNSVPDLHDQSLLARIIFPYLVRFYGGLGERILDQAFPNVWAKSHSSNFPYNERDPFMRASMLELAYAHYGWIVSNTIDEWAFIEDDNKGYPFQPVIDLLLAGVVPSFDGNYWRINAFDGQRIKTLWYEGTGN